VILQLAGFKAESIVDGPGIRSTVFFQGCPHKCPGCHNPETQDPQGGSRISVEELVGVIVKNGGISGITFSGGEPFAQAIAAVALAGRIRSLGLNLVVYSGYTYEELCMLGRGDSAISELLEAAWLLIDGPYLENEQDLTLAFRGSRNQRVIDLKETIKEGSVVEWAGSDDEQG
jgi:anaerobic ribonucleoside-triphosphate reductase activating protein